MKNSTVSHLRILLVLCLTGLASRSWAATTTMAPTTGINATNVTWGSDNGSSCTGAMWACVDDGTSLAANDGDHTYVYSQAAGGFHTTGFAAVSGTVTQVALHIVAAAISGASGNATVSLYASGTLKATGTAHALTGSYAQYNDTFAGLSIPSTSNIQIRVTFSAANLKYTSVWVDATTGTATADPILAGAGDIACDAADRSCARPCGSSCCDCKDGATHTQLVNINPTIVFTLGDNQYENGAYADYSDASSGYASTWGHELGITFPAVGNHEYNGNASCSACGCTGTGCDPTLNCKTPAQQKCAKEAYMRANYYKYFANVKTAEDPNGNGWYSYDVQTSDPSRPWHVIVLNGAICDTKKFKSWASASFCQSGSAQYQWLQQDLASWAAGGKKCLLAYWHEPLFSSGSENGGSTNYAQFWSLLQSYGVDLIMQGHDHNYERFNPQNSSGVADSTGPVSFVVGTGGRDTDVCKSPRAANSAICVQGTFGTLKLTLHPSSWDYDFESAAGTAVSDLRAGVVCHN
ncbi:MAG: metallophosphoesterase [Thermoanaerobaculia bacterium]